MIGVFKFVDLFAQNFQQMETCVAWYDATQQAMYLSSFAIIDNINREKNFFEKQRAASFGI